MQNDLNNELKVQELNDDDFYEYIKIQIDPGQSPLRIDKFLNDRLFKISRNKIQTAISAGSVQVNGNPIKSNYKIRPLDEITLLLPKTNEEEDRVNPEDIPLNIVYEDEDILLINKPAGLVVHPGIGNKSGTLVNGLAYYFQKNLPVKKGNTYDRPGLVHRIDKNTSGLLIIAKTELAMAVLTKQFYEHTIEREYYALVWGELDPEKGTIANYLARNPNNRMQMKCFEEEDNVGKYAVTHYKTLENYYYTSLISCKLETGRTHQIRTHMLSKGNPIFNDERYGGDTVVKGTVFNKYKQFVDNCFKLLPRQALHARTLGFIHPRSGKEMFFECEMPVDMLTVIDKWRNYINPRKEMI